MPEWSSTCSGSRPSASAAIWARAVQAPCPMSAPAVSARALPSVRNVVRASAGKWGHGENGRSHAPAHQKAVLVAHRAWRQRAAGPAEALGALGIAFAQSLRRERLAVGRVGFGIVGEPEVERIHAAGLGRLVHCRFERCRSGCLARRTHRARRTDIEPQAFMLDQDCRGGIERQR